MLGIRGSLLYDMKSELTEAPTMKNIRHLAPDPVIEAYKRDVDRSLLRRNLRLSPEERIENAMELQRLAAEVRRAGIEARKRRS
jgi:hypothetical protein